MEKKYFIHFQLLLTNYNYCSNWQNILVLILPGTRVHGVFLRNPDQLVIRSKIDADKTKKLPVESYPLNAWIDIKIQQRILGGKYMYEIMINGQKKLSVENKTPQSFTGVKVYANSPVLNPQPGLIRDLKFTGTG